MSHDPYRPETAIDLALERPFPMEDGVTNEVTDAAVEALAKELGGIPYQHPIERIYNIARHVLTSRKPKSEDADQIAKTGMSWDELVHAYFL